MSEERMWPWGIVVALVVAIVAGGAVKCNESIEQSMRECIKAGRDPLACRTAIGRVQ